MSNSTPRIPTLLGWSLLWALAIIVSAIVFKGNPLGDWIESFLFVGAFTFWLWLWQRGRCTRVSRPRP